MPSRLGNGTMAARFQLPALNLNFGSITDGTNIPPPPASPIQRVPTPPQTPPANRKEAVSYNAVRNGADKPAASTPPNGNLAGSKRPADEAPLSPAGSGRQGSLRRLFSRNMLNASYTEGRLSSSGSAILASAARPDSRGAVSVMDDRKSRRSSAWFRRLRGGDSKRSSLVLDDVSTIAAPAPAPALATAPAPPPKKPSGPPPPMIPELADLEKDDGGLGQDMFKNIK